jgi:SAM-dependent methyltransferase
MKNRHDDYEGIVAQLYDFQNHPPDDIAFYVEEARRAGKSILDLGCGTGRLLIPLAEAGLTVTGLDLSTDMLAVAKRKVARLAPEAQGRASLVTGDMRRFDLKKRFDAVIVPFRGFQHLPTPEDQKAALRCIRDHLEDGGTLVLDVLEPILEVLVTGTSRLGVSAVQGSEFVNPQTFRRVIVSHVQRASLEQQTLEQWMIYEEIDDSGRVVSKTYAPRTVRWFGRWEMQYLLELSGFRVEALHGDFARGPWRAGGPQVWIAKRAPEKRAPRE